MSECLSIQVLAFGAIMHEVYHATDKDHHSEVNVRTLKNVVFPPECPVAYADLARSCLDPVRKAFGASQAGTNIICSILQSTSSGSDTASSLQ